MADKQHKVDKRAILKLIDNNSLTVHFQSIFSTNDGAVYGHEALTRIKEPKTHDSGLKTYNIQELFKKAILTKTISLLDVKCRENAIRKASSLGITQNGAYLFINMCPEVLIDSAHRTKITDELTKEYGISKENIILELTEESYIQDYKLFRRVLMYYREAGYKVAIDDFGVGYGGLKMLSELTPDFVKIDRYFISDIDTETVKFNLVDAIVIACHKLY